MKETKGVAIPDVPILSRTLKALKILFTEISRQNLWLVTAVLKEPGNSGYLFQDHSRSMKHQEKTTRRIWLLKFLGRLLRFEHLNTILRMVVLYFSLLVLKNWAPKHSL